MSSETSENPRAVLEDRDLHVIRVRAQDCRGMRSISPWANPQISPVENRFILDRGLPSAFVAEPLQLNSPQTARMDYLISTTNNPLQSGLPPPPPFSDCSA